MVKYGLFLKNCKEMEGWNPGMLDFDARGYIHIWGKPRYLLGFPQWSLELSASCSDFQKCPLWERRTLISLPLDRFTWSTFYSYFTCPCLAHFLVIHFLTSQRVLWSGGCSPAGTWCSELLLKQFSGSFLSLCQETQWQTDTENWKVLSQEWGEELEELWRAQSSSLTFNSSITPG